jgi:hypothetical protein
MIMAIVRPPALRAAPELSASREESMCKSIKLDGETFRTVGQLARKVSPANLVWHKGLSLSQLNGDLHYCLCGVDAEATAKGLGLVEVEANRDPTCREFVTAPRVQPNVRRPALLAEHAG